ncbi:hypothetical protein VTK56DRAFT_2432 [Thermocarpiscus australiensis]
MDPPLVPKLRSADDTHYFDEDNSVSDWSESGPEEEDEKEVLSNDEPEPELKEQLPSPPEGYSKPPDSAPTCCQGQARSTTTYPNPHQRPNDPLQYHEPACGRNQFLNPPPAPCPLETPAPAEMPCAPPLPTPEQVDFLRPLPPILQEFALDAVARPLDPDRLHTLGFYIDQLPRTTAAQRAHLRDFIRRFGRCERKRPRDRLLRDAGTKKVAMEVRKRTAFLGYEWRRMRKSEGAEWGLGLDGAGGGDENNSTVGGWK